MDITWFQPAQDNIIVRKWPRAEMPDITLVNGIHRKNEHEPHDFATVIAIGPGRYTETGVMKPPVCLPGDVVMIRRVAGRPETIGGIEYHWCIPDEIQSTVKEPAPVPVLVS